MVSLKIPVEGQTWSELDAEREFFLREELEQKIEENPKYLEQLAKMRARSRKYRSDPAYREKENIKRAQRYAARQEEVREERKAQANRAMENFLNKPKE